MFCYKIFTHNTSLKGQLNYYINILLVVVAAAGAVVIVVVVAMSQIHKNMAKKEK